MNTDNQLLSRARLMVNIQMPSLEECWQEGYESQLSDIEDTANPYAKDSAEYNHWDEGWWAACYGEQPIYELASEEVIAVEKLAEQRHISQHTPISMVTPTLTNKRLLKRTLAIGGVILFAVLCFELSEIAA